DAAGGMYRSNCSWVDYNNTLVTVDNNLSNDTNVTKCFFDTDGDPKFAPPQGSKDAYSWGGNNLPVLMLLPGSPAIDGASAWGGQDNGGVDGYDGCNEVANDERGIARPQGSYGANNTYYAVPCDLGAVEAGNDIIFINGFDSSP
ncbi:MAG: hypothetical protein L0H70_07475, partial [Xanthomonadales bacterium]|nr:hypothetical protein [Xanthomonadales bacterium]